MHQTPSIFSVLFTVPLLGWGMCFGQSTAPFLQDSFPDGVVSIEAEHFHEAVDAHSASYTGAWSQVISGSYSGGEGMQLQPNLGTRFTSAADPDSPILFFDVEFVHTGTHYMVLHGFGPTSADDTCHAGLVSTNGTVLASTTGIGSFRSSGSWINDNFNDDPISFTIPQTGRYRLAVWMREDGFILDKLVVSTNPLFLPLDEGPPESSRVGQVGSGVPEPAPVLTGVGGGGGMVLGRFQPVAGFESYRVVTGPTPQGPFLPAANAAAYAFEAALVPDASRGFMAIEGLPLHTNKMLAALLCNRIAYGATPDLWNHVYAGPAAIGPEAFLAGQMTPESLVETADADPDIGLLENQLDQGLATLSVLRAWTTLRAIRSDRQFHEVLSQFWNNHFVTYYYKTREWFRDQPDIDNATADRLATQMEYREQERWRAALLDPATTFEDLLRISAESVAMIIYLDTVENDAAEPNENYAREIVELFSMGVDNGYEQEDIETISRVWTGWRVGEVNPADGGDPHAPPALTAPLLPAQSTDWRLFKGTEEPPADWRELNFVESGAWSNATTSVGYGDSDDLTILDDMEDNYSTIYLRKPLVVNDLSEIQNLAMNLYVDDGCTVWINDVLVARSGVNGPKNYNAFADTTVGNAEWLPHTPLVDLATVLTMGTNQVAVQVINTSLGSSDLSFDIELVTRSHWQFVFDPAAHDIDEKIIFEGKTVASRFGAPWADQPYELILPARSGTTGVQDGYDLIAHLADLPYTREYISVKLCQLLVHENFRHGSYYNLSQLTPEAELIRACMVAWGDDGGDLRAVLQTILTSELFRSQRAAKQKFKTPFEYCVSALRALRSTQGGVPTSATDGFDIDSAMDYMGMSLYTRSNPDGWPEKGADWISTTRVAERLRFIQHLCMVPGDPRKNTDYGSSRADNVVDPVRLLQNTLPPEELTSAEHVADYFLGLLFPGEGSGNLEEEREECIDLLNSDAVGGASALNTLAVGTPAYDARIRVLVGYLLANPRFMEQ